MARKVIKRAIALDLIHAVYKAEGWTRREGESAVRRVKQYYEITADPRANRYIATPKATCCGDQMSA
jgi:hypothetical protein